MQTHFSGTIESTVLPALAPQALVDILASAADISLVVTGENTIRAVLLNKNHRGLADLSHWVGRPVLDVVAADSLQKLTNRLAQVREAAPGTPFVVELNHNDKGAWEFPVRYALHLLAADGTVLMLGRDLRQVSEIQQKLVAAQMALEKDYEAQREMDTRYRVLMEMTRDAVVMVSMGSGRITDLNNAAAVMLGGARSDLVGSAIAQEFEGRRRGEFLEALGNLAVSDASSPIELTARRSQRRMMVVPMVFRAAGERLLLIRLDGAAQSPSQLDELTDNLNRLFHDGVDAQVFTNRDGTIRAANEAFLNLTDQPGQASVKGRSLADFLVRGAVDLKVLLDNSRRAGHMRLYSTKLTTAFDGQIAVDISAAWLNDRPNPVMGLIIRDASRAEAFRRPGFGAEDGGASVMELVGSSTLKDIVAETTDVVEKLCIETAVELTRNNRVAAAEMLGLSRQSLYVKLRKYGLVNRDGE